MEHFVVSARKYRPKTFKDVVGQQAITNTLRNAIANNHLAQALLFCGPRGVGKTSCARILAREINKQDSSVTDEDFAFNIFELDAASNNSVDDIRTLTEQVRIPPQVGKYKVYIIDEVHMLSQAAFNAFLKTLEEPPKHAIFILATTEKHKIIPTILSRCQIFDFKRITVTDAKEYLKYIAKNQGITAEDDALHIIAQKADGAMRDALSIFDRVVSFCGKNLTRQAVTQNLNVLDYQVYFTITDFILSQDISACLLFFDTTLNKGFDGNHFIRGLASHFRDLMMCKNQGTITLLEVGDNTKKTYLEQSQKTEISFLLQALEIANTCDLQYAKSANQRLLVELCLMQLCSIGSISELKKKQPPKIIAPNIVANTSIAQDTTNTTQQNNIATDTALSQEKSSTENTAPITQNTVMAPKVAAPKRVSGLSLSSLKAKAVHQEKKAQQEIPKEQLPENPFTLEQMQTHWNAYIAILDKEGKKIMASNLATDTPKLKDNTIITIELPNQTMKKEVERDAYGLLEYLKKNLENYAITLSVKVNETIEKKYAFTPFEKYEKLKEINPEIDTLRIRFGLEL